MDVPDAAELLLGAGPEIQYKMASATWRPPPSRPDGVNPTNNSLQLAKGILLCVAGIRNH